MIFNINQNKMREMALEWINHDIGGIIELGCSNGNFAKKLFKKGMTNYYGIDIQQDKINEAKKKLPLMNFGCYDILDNLFILKKGATFISFQCLEHIKDDLKVLNTLKEGTKIIISVPNNSYKGHIRWFELEGWKKRFLPYIEFDYECIIQNPKKLKKRSFLFKGVRNDYKN